MTTVTIESVIENTKREVVDHVDTSELHTILTGLVEAHGDKALVKFENAITILDETGNHDGMLDYMETLMETYL